MSPRKTLPLIITNLLLGACAPDLELSGADTASAQDSTWAADPKSYGVVAHKTFSLAAGSYYQYRFTKYAGYHYAVTADPSSGDVKVYGDYRGYYNVVGTYQYRSDSGGSAMAETYEFDASSNGYYYVTVYAKSAARLELWVERW